VLLGLLFLTPSTNAQTHEPATSDTLGINIGDKAPTFQAKADSGKLWKSDNHIGKSILVVYFFPAALTGGWTRQAVSYRDDSEALKKLGAQIIGVSGDTVEGQRIFKKVNDLNFTLLADTEGNVAKAFGVPLGKGGTINKTINGEDFSLTRGVSAKRWTFIIGKNGKIVYKDTGVKAALDSENTISAIKALTAE